MKLLENGLKAPNIMPDNCQTKEQLCCLIFTEFLLQLWWKGLSQNRTVHVRGPDSDTAGHKEFDLFIWSLQGNFCAKVKEILWISHSHGQTIPKQTSAVVVDMRACTIHRPELKSLLSLVLAEMSLMQGGKIMCDFVNFAHMHTHTHTYSFEV